jgi:hypothetical protein
MGARERSKRDHGNMTINNIRLAREWSDAEQEASRNAELTAEQREHHRQAELTLFAISAASWLDAATCERWARDEQEIADRHGDAGAGYCALVLRNLAAEIGKRVA